MRSTAETASKRTADMNQVPCLLGKVPKGVFTFIRLFVLLLSFSIICLGILCISTRSSTCRCGNNELVFYCLLALGFFLLVTGIFWSTFHEVLKYRGLSSIFIQNPSHRELRISTIDRYVLQYCCCWIGGEGCYFVTILWEERSNTRFLQNKKICSHFLRFLWREL